MAQPFGHDDGVDAFRSPWAPLAAPAPHPVLDPALVEADEAVQPYFNGGCAAHQDIWWLPHTRRDGMSNHRVDRGASAFWRKAVVPAGPGHARSLPIALPGATPSIGSVKVVAARRIRIYPRDEALFGELLRQHRRAYNLAIACIREADERPELRGGEDLREYTLRRTIRDFLRAEAAERDARFHSASCDEAVRDAFRTFRAVLRRRKRKQKAGFHFRSRKNVRQSFIVQRLARGFVARTMDLAEALPAEALGKLTRIVLERGRWFLCAQMHVVTAPRAETQGRGVVAIDPGVRCFAAAYSGDQCTLYGDNFMERSIFPLLLEADRQVSQLKRSNCEQRSRHHRKRLDRLVHRVADRVRDLHRRVAHDLVTRFDVILLPRFEARRMSERTGRKIGSRTVRGMLGLAHYAFRKHLEWMCRKYGKRLVLCNEAYTSKTLSWNGWVVENLGGARKVGDGEITVDRDINGARGTMLRALYGNLGLGQAACAA